MDSAVVRREVWTEKFAKAIVEELSTDTARLDPVLQFASWAARADYHQPLEVFTVNYDLLLETDIRTHPSPLLRRLCR